MSKPEADPEQLRRYAAVVLDVGVGFRAGKELAINAHVEHAPFARILCEEAYARGAAYVDLWYWDPHTKASRLRHAPTDSLARVPGWMEERCRGIGARAGAIVNLVGESEPDLLADVDPARAGLDRMPGLTARYEVQLSGAVEFTTIACATDGWAEQILGRRDAAALWEVLFDLMRLDADDPVRAWQERMRELQARSAALNRERFDALRYAGPGTDLRIGLAERHVWAPARVTSRDGVTHVPALPTEEIFSMPDPRRAEGRIAATKPLVLGGTLVEGLRLRFAGGRIVEATAERGGEAVIANLDLDEGARRLGEVALVDGTSRLARSGLTFFHTLLDESAASHLAWGATIPDSHRDYDPATQETEGLGLNRSATHVDFMVGGPQVTVAGVRRDGSEALILAGDEWQLEERR